MAHNSFSHLATWTRIHVVSIIIEMLSYYKIFITELSIGKYHLDQNRTFSLHPPPPPKKATNMAGGWFIYMEANFCMLIVNA